MGESHGPFRVERTPELTKTNVFHLENESFVKLWKLSLIMEIKFNSICQIMEIKFNHCCDFYIPEFLKPD